MRLARGLALLCAALVLARARGVHERAVPERELVALVLAVPRERRHSGAVHDGTDRLVTRARPAERAERAHRARRLQAGQFGVRERERQIALEREREREKREHDERERERQFELERMRIEAGAANANNNARQNDHNRDFDTRFIPKIPYLNDEDDVESWIHQFEHYARDLKLDEETKASRIVYYLKGKARVIHSKLSDEDARDYESIKAALYEGFQLTAEQYRVKFRSVKKEPKENYKEHVVKLERHLNKWVELDHCSKDVEGLKDLILREQVLRSLPSDIAVHVRDRNPKDAKEIGRIATEYVLNRESSHQYRQPRHEPVKGSAGHDAKGEKRNEDVKGVQQENRTSPKTFPDKERERLRAAGLCFNCKTGVHRAKDCPHPKGKCGAIQEEREKENKPGKLVSLCEECTEKEFIATIFVKVNGKKVEAMRDSGCNSIVVASSLIESNQYIAKNKKTTLADKDVERTYPMAMVRLDTPFFVGETEVIVMDNPIVPVIVGNFRVKDGHKEKTSLYPTREPEWYNEETSTDCAATTTRSEAEREKDEESSTQPEERDEAKDPKILGVYSPAEMIAAQQDDPSLEHVRRQADNGEVKGGKRIVRRRGILYQSTLDRKGTESLCVVVPKALRSKVLAYSHEHPMAGHLGQKRTAERIRREFWWPGCGLEIRRYCLSCDICQRTAPKHLTKKVPLGKMPIFDTAFKRVAVDIIGPITPMSESKCQYVLTMIDYATRYPEAVPLKNVKAETVADALWNFWTRLGIPETVLSDNGSQFTCELMREVEKLLRIKHKVCSVFHPAGNGLVERLNGSLKTSLRKMCIDQPKKWDTFIPALLFALRETPQESLGFSPFELLYGRTVRGPMQLLRQIWTEDDVSDEERTTAEYIVDLRNKIEETCKLARENLMKASRKQAKYYNQKAKPRTIAVNAKVLILRTTKQNKLELTWQGPFVVEEKINEFDYRIKIGSKSKIYHINLLKEYIEREDCQDAVTAVIRGVDKDEDDEEVVAVVIEEDETMSEIANDSDSQRHIPTLQTVRTETIENIHFGPNLSEKQISEVKAICKEKSENLSDVPLTTNLTTCRIKLSTEQPVYVRPRPIPHALVKNVENEVQEMLNLGVIEPACSPYNSPIVMVKKKGGDFRFCADLRALNDVCVFDGEPLTDVQHLFQSLGKAKYFSKLDLTKGYWAIPIEEEDRDKTAFTTSKGQFRWVNLPFGLKTASGIFNRMMRKLLGPLHRNDVHHFMDDILIATETWEEHTQALKAVLTRLEEANLAAKPSKVYIGYNQLPFLGHEVGDGQRWPDTEKTEKILNAPAPKTKKELRSFLGLCSFYREYIDSFSSLTAPLSDMTKKDQPEKIAWTTEATKSFEELKSRLGSKPVLKMPDNEKEFVLRTDASDRGLGAVLLQEHEGKLHPVAYQSKKLLGAESRYAIVEKECLGTVWGIQKFERFLYGKHFTLETDHQPLKCLQKTPTNPRLIRWALQLQPYRFTIRVIPGKDNLGADYLSRAFK